MKRYDIDEKFFIVPVDDNAMSWDIYEVMQGTSKEGKPITREKNLAYGVKLSRVFEYLVNRKAFEKADTLKSFVIEREKVLKEMLKKVDLFKDVDLDPLKKQAVHFSRKK